ncbi:phosphotransferase [Lentzea sp. NPDC055074]
MVFHHEGDICALARSVMTQTIRGLIVDDSKLNLSNVVNRLDTYLHQLEWMVDWEKLTDPDEAFRSLSRRDGFDLVVIDLLFERPDMEYEEVRGHELVELARQNSPNAFVLVISSGDKNRPDLFSEAEQAGAHRVLRRREFTTDSKDKHPAVIARDIRKHLLENGSVREIPVTADRHDPSVQSFLFDIGEATLPLLHQQVLDATKDLATTIEVRYLAPGASGASVCETVARLKRGQTVHHVLKVSRALSALQTETDKALLARQSLPSRFLVPIHPDRPVGPINGWYATGAPRDQKVVTLRQWLASGPAPTQVEELFEALFALCLGPMYRDTLEQVREQPLDFLDFKHYKQRLILYAIEELVPCLVRPEGGGIGEATKLRADLSAFVTERRMTGVLTRQVPATCFLTYAHGDLHGGNILLYDGKHPAPALIDFSEFGPAHWATDVARLAVDLVLRVVDTGAESMFFTGIGSWRRLVDAVGDLSPDLTAASRTPATSAALAGLKWIVEHLREICPPLQENFDAHVWEWHAALSVYLLRGTYRHEIPGPKRALALLAAHDQLLKSVSALRRAEAL